ncbi:response regulator [Parapedobacter koreensis]|uniref:Two component transcriptional regulator, LuxR family n=1 Tax=Parapedobacter koreensis TaxID=332977 RepID=A0A1H7U875_9SPHI|nr:response regulator transcription factor [Parapedobacter koreensis]SEL93203.1 two component transcriptional regulator, LuxR family [Parapedobacter koreensis]
MKHSVLLVDDHPILTDGLKMVFKEDPKFDIVASMTSGNYALAFLKVNAPDLMVTDYSIPDMTGVELIRHAKILRPALKTIVLTMHDEASIVKEAISAGADGYVLKKSAMDDLAIAMETVLAGKPYLSAEAAQRLFQLAKHHEPNESLTDREVEVLRLIVKELTNKEIAARLCISDRTVEVHRKNLMRKIKCNNMVGLIKYAFAHDLVN